MGNVGVCIFFALTTYCLALLKKCLVKGFFPLHFKMHLDSLVLSGQQVKKCLLSAHFCYFLSMAA